MPRRRDLKKIMLIGSGPIVIGQACEFDYSGVQACKALKEEGYQVVLVNSNPATIMTDPEMAERTYLEPLSVEILEKIIKQEHPQALLPTLGGQTALNLTLGLAEEGILAEQGVELIGAKLQAIKKAEDRNLFKKAMERVGLNSPQSGYASSLEDALSIFPELKFPLIIRPSFTLGGMGGNIAYNLEELKKCIAWGLEASPVNKILLEESLIGWKEYELEVIRDLKDNVVIICSIENFDPMGIHTGDSITVAPAQTLSDKEYQVLRDAAIKIIREIGVETGGANIQFALNPDNGKLIVIEMNPRVSRSSALASKATGFPIAKIAAKLAVGYSLDELKNDITRTTPCSFEPVIDYCVVKFPRFAFEKFPAADQTLTTQMKSVGEVMAIGRTFKEALNKAIRSLEINRYGLEDLFGAHSKGESRGGESSSKQKIREKLKTANWERIWYLAAALRRNFSLAELYELTKIDPWFLNNLKELVDFEKTFQKINFPSRSKKLLRRAKELGFSDPYLAKLLSIPESRLRNWRKEEKILPVFKKVDTCAGEFAAHTPYLYSTYEEECEADPNSREKIIILGGGPNRIGQGIEFDYCCVQAVMALKKEGFETIMINCNPETVSTDYDLADRLYFEPLTLEDVLNIVEKESPAGVIVQFGGQTPLKLTLSLAQNGVRILGTSPDSIDQAEDRKRFKKLLKKLGLKQSDNATVTSPDEALYAAQRIGYPVIVRPSYVLGGRAMEIVYDRVGLKEYLQEAVRISPKNPVLIDKFLEGALEVDVDALCDGEESLVAGIMEHIEEAGIHSGDSACSLPSHTLPPEIIKQIKEQTQILALELKVKGLINIQYAVRGGEIFVLEVNPRASRTVPFVSKAVGLPLAKFAARIMAGRKLKKLLREIDYHPEKGLKKVCIKEAVFPFIKFPGVDVLLGPEMKSTGEVMGIDSSFGKAFAKSQIAAGSPLPKEGTIFISVKDQDKSAAVKLAGKFYSLGFKLAATAGTAELIARAGIEVKRVLKVIEGRPHIVDQIKNREIALVINTSFGQQSIRDSYSIRRASLSYNIPYCTTIAGAFAAANGIKAVKEGTWEVKALQDYYP